MESIINNKKCRICGNEAYNSLRNPSVYYCDKHFEKIMNGERDRVGSKRLSLREAVNAMKAFEKRT